MVDLENIRGVSYHYNRQKNKRYFMASYQYEDKGIARKFKSYSANKYGAKKAFELALTKRKSWERDFGIPLQTYKDKRNFINSYEIEDNYFKLVIIDKRTDISKRFKIDLNKLEEINKYYWFYNKYNKQAITSYNGERLKLRDVLYPNENKVLNHINRDKFDYRREFVEFRDSPDYAISRKYEETAAQPPGVAFLRERGKEYWCATYHKEDKNLKRRFRIKHYGYNRALDLAKEQREDWINELG